MVQHHHDRRHRKHRRLFAATVLVAVLVAVALGIAALRSSPAASERAANDVPTETVAPELRGTEPDEGDVSDEPRPVPVIEGIDPEVQLAAEQRGESSTKPVVRSGALAALAGRTIGVDAGHNGGNGAHASEINQLIDAGTLRKACDTTGTQTPGGYTESAFNLDVALRLQRLLEGAGARVVMVRIDDSGWGPCIDERARITSRGEFAVSVHADGNLGAGARGFHVIVPASVAGLTDDIAAPSRSLGEAIVDALDEGTPIPRSNYLGTRGIDVRSDIGGINLSTVPKVLIETGNMKHAADRRELESAAGRQRIAAAIATGLATWAVTNP